MRKRKSGLLELLLSGVLATSGCGTYSSTNPSDPEAAAVQTKRGAHSILVRAEKDVERNEIEQALINASEIFVDSVIGQFGTIAEFASAIKRYVYSSTENSSLDVYVRAQGGEWSWSAANVCSDERIIVAVAIPSGDQELIDRINERGLSFYVFEGGVASSPERALAEYTLLRQGEINKENPFNFVIYNTPITFSNATLPSLPQAGITYTIGIPGARNVPVHVTDCDSTPITPPVPPSQTCSDIEEGHYFGDNLPARVNEVVSYASASMRFNDQGHPISSREVEISEGDSFQNNDLELKISDVDCSVNCVTIRSEATSYLFEGTGNCEERYCIKSPDSVELYAECTFTEDGLVVEEREVSGELYR